MLVRAPVSPFISSVMQGSRLPATPSPAPTVTNYAQTNHMPSKCVVLAALGGSLQAFQLMIATLARLDRPKVQAGRAVNCLDNARICAQPLHCHTLLSFRDTLLSFRVKPRSDGLWISHNTAQENEACQPADLACRSLRCSVLGGWCDGFATPDPNTGLHGVSYSSHTRTVQIYVPYDLCLAQEALALEAGRSLEMCPKPQQLAATSILPAQLISQICPRPTSCWVRQTARGRICAL